MHGGFALALPALECWAAFDYDGPAGAMVRALKFGGRPAIADFMAGQIAAHAPPEWLAGAIVPVPVHPVHRRRRGVDHALTLAAALAERTGLELARCLERRGDARPQVGRGRGERMRAPEGTFVATARAPRRALLIDDVVTTGATLCASAQALRGAGTAQIAAIAYARTAAR